MDIPAFRVNLGGGCTGESDVRSVDPDQLAREEIEGGDGIVNPACLGREVGVERADDYARVVRTCSVETDEVQSV